MAGQSGCPIIPSCLKDHSQLKKEDKKTTGDIRGQSVRAGAMLSRRRKPHEQEESLTTVHLFDTLGDVIGGCIFHLLHQVDPCFDNVS